jgi:hypothetical protein
LAINTLGLVFSTFLRPPCFPLALAASRPKRVFSCKGSGLAEIMRAINLEKGKQLFIALPPKKE